tara:strand:+ start:28 stop:489 length:462 start_codon:yes stop_codon:yes gene_type:complete
MNNKTKAPSFLGLITESESLSLKDFSGKYLVLYFYPRDMTSGCTLESQDFRDHYKSFQKNNCEILGVSRDTIKSHIKFCEKESLPFKLISDPDEKLCKAYDVMKEKSMYGKKFMGIERSTFLINPNGEIIKEWRKVKVTGHVEEVLSELKEVA